MKEEYRASKACTVAPDGRLIQKTRERIEEWQKGGNRRKLRAAALAACLGLMLLAAPLLPGLLSPQGTEPAAPVSTSARDSVQTEMPGSDATAIPQQDEDRVKTGHLESLDLEGAYSVEELGEVLPRTALPGYDFEEAGLFTDGERSLYCTWTHGFSYLTVTARPAAQEDRDRLVAAEEEEKYDITRYEIPLADTVPEALWETVMDPVFRAEELTPHVLELRIIHGAEDIGDDGGDSMTFELLCGNMLVRYMAKGPDLSGMYDAVTSADWFQREH